MRIGLDSNIFAYALSSNPDWSPPAVALLRRIESGQAVGVASALCLTEVLAGFDPGSELAENAQLFMEGLQGVDYFSVDVEVAILAGRLRATYGPKLRTPDALQVATALVQGAEVLVTNDRSLVELKVDRLRIRRLGESLD